MNKHTKSRMDGGDGLERAAGATCSDCRPNWGARYKSPEPIILCPLHKAADDLLAALIAILEHVEDTTAERLGTSQCTLCHTYRMTGWDAIAKVRGQ